MIDPPQESRFRRLESIKNKRGQKKNLRSDSRKVIPNDLEEERMSVERIRREDDEHLWSILE
jgi:hypothetical protein